MWAVSARGFLVLLRIIALGLALWKHKRQWKLIVICFALAGLLFYGVSEFFFKDILVHFT
jgi:type IV secretory pathway VirB2 component (pilin)